MNDAGIVAAADRATAAVLTVAYFVGEREREGLFPPTVEDVAGVYSRFLNEVVLGHG